MSTLTITTPAPDYNLLTASELRLSVGVGSADTSQDATLTPIGLRVSAAIARACNVATAAASPATLRSETLTERFRLDGWRRSLRLSRRPVTAITSIVEAGVTLTADDYEMDASAGMIDRLSGDCVTCWAIGRTTVVYVAGWATVPDDLKLAASKLTQAYYATSGDYNPLLRSEEVPDVHKYSFNAPGTDGAGDGSALPAEVEALLEPYRMRWL
jgi:hypothetical protein